VRSATFIAVTAGLVLLGAGAVAVYAYDSGRESRIADGVRVGGVDVGGLDRAAAARRLRADLLDPLSAPVVVRARGARYTLTAKVARLTLDLDGMVDEAVRRSRDGNPLTRTARDLTGGTVDAEIEPEVRYSSAAVRRLVARVRRHVERPSRDARVRFTGVGIERVRSRTGFRLDRDGLRARVEQALVRRAAPQRRLTAKVRRLKPKVTTAKLAQRYPAIITVDRGGHRLRLFKRLELEKTYPIAVGQVGLETPAGRYEVQNKAINPAWTVPNSAWAGDLAGTVVPGGVPENPLKARWLGIYNGAGIHGTDAIGSIGTNASHGCIRMLIPDVVELYDQVGVGAPVYIV
jgi:lipoprotein-anchoring transpeptidase ErfK/SrfK